MCDTESPLCHFLYYGDDILKATGGDHMLPYTNKVAEKRKARKEKPKKQAERACIFRLNSIAVPEERHAVPLQTARSAAD